MSREIVLDQWIYEVLRVGTGEIKRLPLSNDASFRQYYRVQCEDSSYVVMDAPPPENPGIFCDIAQVLKVHKVNVPNIIHKNLTQGFLLLSDFGDRLYLNELNERTADPLYQDALSTLIEIQQCTGEVPHFDKTFLSRQMDIFKEWYLERHLGVTLDSKTQALIGELIEQFAQIITIQPQVFVHRDYHSRNLMILEEGNPGVLDFQDAMVGPITYDLVSLLQDCYIAWPRARVEGWVAQYQEKAEARGLVKEGISLEEFLRWFDMTGLQRHLKNLGVFSRLYYRDGKSQYLNDIPLVCRYIKETLDRYSEERYSGLKPFASFFNGLRAEGAKIKCVQ